MKLRMYSIFDKKSLIHHPPQFLYNTGHALRYFKSTVERQERSFMTDYPEDFDVYEVGSFDDQTGVVEKMDKPQYIVNMGELIDHKPQPLEDTNENNNR